MCPLVHFSEGNAYKIDKVYNLDLKFLPGIFSTGMFVVAAYEGKSGDISQF